MKRLLARQDLVIREEDLKHSDDKENSQKKVCLIHKLTTTELSYIIYTKCSVSDPVRLRPDPDP